MAKGILTRRGGGAGEPTPPPNINFVSATGTSITFTITNNSIRDRDITYGLTTPPTTTTINIAENSTSAEQTISGLDPSTAYIIYAQAEDSTIIEATLETVFEPIQATGGTITDIDDYRYHVFTSTGTSTFSVQDTGGDGKIDYLIVAGGGGGGRRVGGGGGAGGLIFKQNESISVQNYSISVGNGGNGATANTNIGQKGANSTFFSLTALGGGPGASDSANNASTQSGGSGGGCEWNVDTFGQGLQPTSASGGFGNRGGTPSGSQSPITGGGGGGAGQVGDTTIQNGGTGKGGDGINLSEFFPNWGTNSSNTTTGIRGWFAGGGGGGNWSGSTRNYVGNNMAAGIGGGGRGESANTPGSQQPGLDGTGGGGGSDGRDERVGAKGGSGIVIIRYTLTKPN